MGSNNHAKLFIIFLPVLSVVFLRIVRPYLAKIRFLFWLGMGLMVLNTLTLIYIAINLKG